MTGRTVVFLDGHPPALRLFRLPLLRAIADRGHRLTVCSPAAERCVVDAVEAAGATWREVRIDRARLDPLADLAAYARLVRLFRELAPDLVLLRTLKAVVYGSLAASRTGVPRIASLIAGLGYAFGDGGATRRLVNLAATRLIRSALARNSCVLFQNPDDRALFGELGLLGDDGRAVVVAGSGVDLERFRPAPLPARPSFLMLARLVADKGVREYVAAARMLRQWLPAARCRLAGWIDESRGAIAVPEIRGWARAGDIDFLGRLDDVRPAIADSSAVVLPSYYREGTPRSLIEGLAMGRPLVTTDMPGCRETVREGVNGLLVPPRDAAALARAMRRLAEHPELLPGMAAASRRLAEARFDVHAVNRDILAALEL